MKTEASSTDPQNGRLLSSSNLKGFLEITGASISLLATAGYISLRAFSNFVGLAGVQELTVQQLLFECYAVSGAFFLVAIPLLCVAAALFSVVGVLGHFVGKSMSIRSCIANHPDAMHRAAFVVFNLCILTLTIWIYSSLSTEVLLKDVAHLRLLTPHPEIFFCAVTLTLSLIALTCSSRVAEIVEQFRGKSAARDFRLLAGALAIFYVWISALAYNVHFRQLSFPVVSILPASSNASSICGLLVYLTNQSRFLWQTIGSGENAKGQITAVPREARDQFRLQASRSVVKIAQEVFDGRPSIPECN